MGQIHEFQKEKLIVGVIFHDEEDLAAAAAYSEPQVQKLEY